MPLSDLTTSLRSFAIVAAVSLTASAAAAQAPQPVRGVVKTISATEMTITTAAKKDVAVKFAPDWGVMIVEKTSLNTIKPGSFIGTTNVDNGKGGRSTEVHVFPPGVKIGEGQRVMDAASGTKMTNGTVGKVVKASGGPEMEISFPGGVRHVKVPPSALITSMTPTDRSYLKAKMNVSIIGAPGPDGVLVARFVSTGRNGAPPAR